VLGIVGRDGCHAEYVSLPAANLLEVPANVPDEQAVFVEPLAAAYGIMEQVEILPATRTAVIGDGKLGLLCALSLNLKSENAFLIGKHKEKMSIAEKAGIEAVMLEDAAKMNRSFDVAVEASGSESGFQTALDLLRPRGKLVLKSTFSGKPTWEAWRVVVDEITVLGSRCGRFAPALKLLEEGKIDVESFISDEFSLSEALAAMERAAAKGVLKVLLKIDN
jgi:threonine dehydrogenase-like Zn-dependent dehydrogenase